MIVSVEVYENREVEHPLVRFNASLISAARRALDSLRGLIADRVIMTPEVQQLEFRGQQIVVKLFEALAADPGRLLKANFARSVAGLSNVEVQRTICDFVAGMTDDYATRTYERLFVPGRGQFSDRL